MYNFCFSLNSQKRDVCHHTDCSTIVGPTDQSAHAITFHFVSQRAETLNILVDKNRETEKKNDKWPIHSIINIGTIVMANFQKRNLFVRHGVLYFPVFTSIMSKNSQLLLFIKVNLERRITIIEFT